MIMLFVIRVFEKSLRNGMLLRVYRNGGNRCLVISGDWCPLFLEVSTLRFPSLSWFLVGCCGCWFVAAGWLL